MRMTSLLRRVALVPALAAGLLAVSPLPGAGAPEVRAESCLTGRWQSTDIETYMRSVLSSPGFTVVSVAGTQRYLFGEDGTFINTVDDVVVRSESAAGTMTVRMTGTITGAYREAGDYLEFSGVSGSIEAAVAINDQPLPVATPVPGIVGDGGAPTRFTCAGDTMTLTPEVPERTVAPQVYARQ